MFYRLKHNYMKFYGKCLFIKFRKPEIPEMLQKTYSNEAPIQRAVFWSAFKVQEGQKSGESDEADAQCTQFLVFLQRLCSLCISRVPVADFPRLYTYIQYSYVLEIKWEYIMLGIKHSGVFSYRKMFFFFLKMIIIFHLLILFNASKNAFSYVIA